MATLCRIALINPPNTRGMGREDDHSVPPLGIAYIAAFLRYNGLQADLFDFSAEAVPSETLLRAFNFFNYEIYGFTSYTKTFPAAISLMQRVRENRPDSWIVLGGPHATPCAREIVAQHLPVDIIVVGDGERPMLGIAHSFPDSNALTHVPNIVYRLGQNVCASELRESPPPLDSLPFPLREYKFEPTRAAYETRRHSTPAPILFMSSSRGCPKRCSFCSIVVMNPKYRFRSVESLITEIAFEHERNPFGHITFHDPNFFAHAHRAREFARALHFFDSTLTWSATATADSLARNPDIVHEIGALNCLALEVGIENGALGVLERYNKRTTVEQNEQALALLDSAGIDIALDFIMFNPETTLDELIQNVDFLRRNDLRGLDFSDHLFNALKVYPGTPDQNKYRELFGTWWEAWDPLLPPFVHSDAAAVYRSAIAFAQRVRPSIEAMIRRLEDAIHRIYSEPAPTSTEALNAQIATEYALRLKHLPDQFFEELVNFVTHEKNRHFDPDVYFPSSVSRLDGLLSSADEVLAHLTVQT